MLPRVGEIATGIDRYKDYWKQDDHSLDDTERALRAGRPGPL